MKFYFLKRWIRNDPTTWKFSAILGFSCKLSKNYAFEIDLLRVIRFYKDGIEFFDFNFHWNRYGGDHNPSAGLILTILNLKIIEMEIYNVNHEGE